jgi:outer membrane protein TolC
VLAQIDAGVAQQEFLGVLQQHLLEVVRAYWLLYQERSTLAQQVRLYLSTEKIVSVLQTRQSIDAQRTQLITASSALENRRSDLIRARTAVINAETRLRGLINAPELSRSDIAELIPTQQPALDYLPSDLQTEIQTAVQNRPEVQIAIQQVKAGATRLGIAQHELLPALNLVTQGFVNGLNGNNDFGGSFVDQFSEGAPSYSVGINYELPIGNRLARTRLCRRQVEARQLQARYELALANIQTEVDIAFRELQTAYREIQARSRALGAAESEAKTIEMRWSRFIDGNANAGLNLESLLRAQERVTQAERDYVTSLLTYNLAVVNLKRANGTLLNCENVQVNKACDENGCGILQIEKFDFSLELATVGQNQIIDTGMTNEASIYETALPSEVPSLEPLSGTDVNLGDLEQ